MKNIFIISVIAFSFLAANGQTQDEIAIRKVLDTQVTAWNAGNIDNFMKGYWQNDSLMFIGKSGVTYGWQATLDNYKKHYPDTAAMGKLTFNLLEFKMLSSVYYFVVGKWHLQRSIGNVEGHFTLLFRKINGEWLIVADHSS
jgi:ketosteroid isomerase-like protein